MENLEIEMEKQLIREKWAAVDMATMFNNNGIKKVNLISAANSIGSGYSLVNKTIPTLDRSTLIDLQFRGHNIGLQKYHFARFQNNNDEHFIKWLTDGKTTVSDFNKFARSDMENGTPIINSEDREKFWPLDEQDDRLVSDVVFSNEDNEANILIYNGITGSFLDNVTRGGKHVLTGGIKRDQASIEATLKLIQIKNREGYNTQVYLCGVPYMPAHVSDTFMNKRLMEVADQYANVTYVDNFKRSMFYRNQDGKLQPDTHYNEVEYLTHNNNVFDSIAKNYHDTQTMIEMDRMMSECSSRKEFRELSPFEERQTLEEIAEKADLLSTNKKRDKAKKYLLERRPYDFFYVDKNTIKDTCKRK